MDAAQKLLKASAILLAIALLMAAPGWAQPTLVVPGTVAIGAAGSNDASVTSSAAGTTEITYTIGLPDYSADPGAPAWLTVTGGTTTPTSLHFQARNVAGLSSAMHSATVILHPTAPAGADSAITVTFDTSGGGGGSSTLTAAPPTVALTDIITSQGVNISTSSASTIAIGVSASGVSGSIIWLTASLNNTFINSTSPGILTVAANPTGLPAGPYQGSVTLTPSTGTPLIITVTLTVNGSSGGGTWSASPSSIPWGFTTNIGVYPSQSVTVSTTSGLTSYSVNTTNNSNLGHWLMVSANGLPANFSQGGIPVGAPFTLLVGSQANNLLQGTYSDQAIITDSNGSQVATVTVNLTVNGSGTVGLTLSPSSVNLASAVNGGQQSQVVTVTSSTGGTLTVAGCASSGTTWLTCALPANTFLSAGVATSFTVYGNPNGLVAGITYSGQLTIQVGSQSGLMAVSLVIGGGSGTGTTAVAPTSLAFAYEYGTLTSSVTRQKLVITGPPGAWSTVITTSNGVNWLKLGPSSGSSLPDPSNDGATPIVSIDPTGLVLGTYTGSITVTTAGGSQAIQVTLKVVVSTIIVPNPAGALIFTAQSGQARPVAQAVYWSYSDNLLNLGSSPVTATSNNTWITLSGPVQGAVTVQVDQTGLVTGVYSGSISLTQASAANSPVVVSILLVVNGGGGGGTYFALTFTPSTLAFTAANGVATPNFTILTVSADNPTLFASSIAYTNGLGSWLTVSPSSGTTTANLSVSADPTGLIAGTYNATISFTANGVVQTVNTSLTVSSPGGNTGNVTVSPTALTFTAPQGASPAAKTVSVSSVAGAAGVSFTTQVTVGSTWLSTNAGATNTTPATLTVSVNSITLAPNTYSGNIRVTPSGGTAVDIPVTLTITAGATPVSATPTQMNFAYRLGDSAPAAQPITVSGTGAFSATASSTGNWLVATPASGTAPGTVNVSIATANIPGTGILNGTIVVAGTGGATGSTTITVTLTVTSSLPTLSRVTNAASYAAGSISPGEIVTLFADDPTHPIGPATAAYLSLDVNGNVATSLGGVQVTVAGYDCPMIYASAKQVSAVVPYEVGIYNTANVLVKFLGQGSNGILMNVATTVPGLFTYDSSGTGPGAILNSNLSVNTAANPATRGDVVVIYLTGEGQTSPGGVTGKVTTVDLTPGHPLTPAPLLPISVTIGSQPAQWTFAGEAPGFVSGVLQLNVVTPTNIAAGNQPIVVTIGGNPSQQGVTVALK